jgi:hypothetical protein
MSQGYFNLCSIPHTLRTGTTLLSRPTCLKWCQQAVVEQAFSLQVLWAVEVRRVPPHCSCTRSNPGRSEGCCINGPAQLLCNDEPRRAAAGGCATAVTSLAHDQGHILAGPPSKVVCSLHADCVPEAQQDRDGIVFLSHCMLLHASVLLGLQPPVLVVLLL